jgi:octopine/nopaline transport system permease protein
MAGISPFELMGFGPRGWGFAMLSAAGMTILVASLGFLLGALLGGLIAWAKLSSFALSRRAAAAYTTVLRGVPDLLVIYLLYFGGSGVLSTIGGWFGASGFIGVPALATGAVAIGVVSAAYQAEVYRGAYLALSRGEIEAAWAIGMGRTLALRRIILPQLMGHAIPGLGNVWQVVLKESALISVTGLIELLRQAQMGAGSTQQPFPFYFAAAALYLAITSFSTFGWQFWEDHVRRGVRSR